MTHSRSTKVNFLWIQKVRYRLPVSVSLFRCNHMSISHQLLAIRDPHRRQTCLRQCRSHGLPSSLESVKMKQQYKTLKLFNQSNVHIYVPSAKYCWSVATVANNILRKIPKEVFKSIHAHLQNIEKVQVCRAVYVTHDAFKLGQGEFTL